MNPRKISTIYLLPHAHTDIGYSHDPVVAIELHDRFLDCAIALCEQTRGHAEGARFRWTVEVFFQVLHWWERRGEGGRARLTECLRRGEIDIGGRYLNGTECYAPGDVEWEMGEFESLRELTGYTPDTALRLQSRDPFLGLWIYNNYWGTNFPSNSPGHFRTRFALEFRDEPFHPETAAQTASAFDVDYLTHPVA